MASDVHLRGVLYTNSPHTCRARTGTSCTPSRRRSWSSCYPRTGASKQRYALRCVGVAAAALPLAVRLDRRRKGDSWFGIRYRPAGVRPLRQQAATLPASRQTTAPSSGLRGTLRHAAEDQCGCPSTARPRDRSRSRSHLGALDDRVHEDGASGVSLAGLEQRSSGRGRSSGAATANRGAAQSRSQSGWADLLHIWITLSPSPLSLTHGRVSGS